MADAIPDSENWDDDELDIPQCSHEDNVNDLMKRNLQLLKRESDEKEKREPFDSDSENWDDEELDIPQCSHEDNDLMKRNLQLLKKESDEKEKREPFDSDSENWDDDELDIPQCSHEDTVNDLMKRNLQLLKRESDEKREMDEMTAKFEDSVRASEAADAVDNYKTRWNDPDRLEGDKQEFCYVQSDPKKVYVKNINFRTTQMRLWEFFSRFGRVRYCQLLKHPNGKSKGRAFVTYTKKSSALSLLEDPPLEYYREENQLELDDRILQVEPATWKKYSPAVKPEDEICDEKNISEDQHPGVTEHSFIDMLDDHTMLYMFKFLSMRELFTCERVCKKWRHICLRKWQSIKFLSFKFLQTVFIRGFSDKVFCNLMKRSCSGLQSIDLSMVCKSLSDISLDAIGKYCPGIRHLDVSGMPISNKGLQKLATNCRQLQEVNVSSCPHISEKGLWYLLSNCKDLRDLRLDWLTQITGKCFYQAANELEKLSLHGCHKLSDVALEKLSVKCEKLNELNLKCCDSLTVQGMSHLSKFSSLEVLILSKCASSIVNGLSLERLCNLRELYLDENHTVNSQYVNNIGLFCPQLQVLDISGTSVRLENVRNLRKCMQLHTLYANRLEVGQIGFHVIKQGCKLRNLYLCRCTDIEETDMIYIATSASHLEKLDIRHTDLGGYDMEMFVNILTAEPSRHLTLLIEGTYINPDAMQLPVNLVCQGSSRMDTEIEADFGWSDDHDDMEEFDEADVDDDDAMIFLNEDDPLFYERFELS